MVETILTPGDVYVDGVRTLEIRETTENMAVCLETKMGPFCVVQRRLVAMPSARFSDPTRGYVLDPERTTKAKEQLARATEAI